MSSNYSAVVVRLGEVRKHSNADRLMCTTIFGNNIIVGLDAKEGDVGIYFPLEAQIGQELADANDLIRRKDEDGKPAGGMFDKNRRVRAQSFRGEKSMGYFMTITDFFKIPEFAALILEDGDDLDIVAGMQVSKKFELPKRMQSEGNSLNGKKAKRESRVVEGQFNFHFDTAQLGRNMHKVQPDDLISITWKFHGTSGVAAYVKCKKTEFSIWNLIGKKLGLDIVDTYYDYVFSSRKVIKNDDKVYHHFYDSDLWTMAGNMFKTKLRKGESVYYELVGHTDGGKEIQKGYDYKCAPNTSEIYVYRMTSTNEDGDVIEMPWHQVKHRCEEMGFKTVPEIYYGNAYELMDDRVHDEAYNQGESFSESFFGHLGREYVYDQDSYFCNNKVPEEGIVVRVERGNGIECFKYKSFKFLGHETKMLDKGEADVESEESAE